MAFKNKKYAHFIYDTPPPMKHKLGGIDGYIFDHKLVSTIIGLVVLALGLYFFAVATVAVLVFVAMLVVKTNAIVIYTQKRNVLVRSIERTRERKLLAELNGLTYEDAVSLQSDIGFSDTDTIVTDYISGEIAGYAFWNAVTRYEYDGSIEEPRIVATGATAIFLQNEIPKIQIINKDTLHDAGLSDIATYTVDNFKITQQFDKQYVTRIEKGKERDVLYILTPELLHLIMHYSPTMIEMQGTRVIFHSPIIETEDDYKFLAEMIQELGGEFIDNTKRYKKHIAKKQKTKEST